MKKQLFVGVCVGTLLCLIGLVDRDAIAQMRSPAQSTGPAILNDKIENLVDVLYQEKEKGTAAEQSDEDQSDQPADQDGAAQKGEPDDGGSAEKDGSNDKSDPSKESKSRDETKDSDKKKPSRRRSFFSRESERTAKYSKRAKDFISVFDPVVASAATSTVKVMSGSRQLALGIVVDGEGYILTKASELKGELSCEFSDGRQVSAKVHGIHPETDLAMLKVDIDQINVVQWKEGESPIVGQWVASPNLKSNKVEVGVVGVDVREIPPSRPFIGIYMDTQWDKGGAKIMQVQNGTPADDADILVSDVITHVDDVEIRDSAHLIETVGQYDPGDRVTLTINRADKKVKLKLELAERDKISSANDRSNQQNSMGSILSRRRKNFPNAFQHDSGLNSNLCGGPVVDLNGLVVGINIARAGRVSSLSLPVQTVLPIMALLKTGDLAPEIVNKQRIAEIDAELEDIRAKLGHLPDKKATLESKYQIENAKKEELERALKGLED